MKFKSLFLDFFRGLEVDEINLGGLEWVMSFTAGDDNKVRAACCADEWAVGSHRRAAMCPCAYGTKPACGIHYAQVYMRTYRTSLKKSGTRTPRVELVEMGPHMDLTMRRTQFAAPELMKMAMKVWRAPGRLVYETVCNSILTSFWWI
jgi:ribosome production factor 2